jgi:streptogramin lyase
VYKFCAMIGVAILGLILSACQSPTPVSPAATPPVGQLSLLPTVTPSVSQPPPSPTVAPSSSPAPEARILCQASTSFASSSTPLAPNGAWQFWSSSSNPLGASYVALGDNVIWVSTSSGVVRLDPSSYAYTTFTVPGKTHLILPIENGQVFAMGERGLFYFDGQTWCHVELPTTAAGWGCEFAVDNNGDLWTQTCGTRNTRSFHFKGHVPPPDSPWIEVGEGGFAIQDPFDCARWRMYAAWSFNYHTPEECQRYAAAYQRMRQLGRSSYSSLALDAGGTLWLADTDLQRIAPDGSTLLELAVPFPSNLAADSKGDVWLATVDGLFVADENGARRVSLRPDQYPLFTPSDIAVDTSGNVWVANERGVQRLSADTRDWRFVDGVDPGEGIGLGAAHDDGLWLTRGCELLYYDGHTLNVAPSLPPGNRSYCNLSGPTVDSSGNVWLADYSNEILQFNPTTKEWQRYEMGQPVRQVSIGNDGTVYALNLAGKIKQYSPVQGTWQTVVGLERPDYTIAADNQGGVWAGGFKSRQLRWYRPGSATPLVQPVLTDQTFSLFVDRQNRLWVFTIDELMRFDGSRWLIVSTPPIGRIIKMAIAPDGRWWFAGENGVAVYDPKREQ